MGGDLPAVVVQQRVDVRSSSFEEFGKTAEKVFCRVPTALYRSSSGCSRSCRAITAATAEESRPPESEVPTGTSDCRRSRTDSWKRSRYSSTTDWS